MAEFNIDKALEYYEQEMNATEATKKHCKELGIPYEEKYRHRVSRALNPRKTTEEAVEVERGVTITNITEAKEDKYVEPTDFTMPSAWDPELGRFLDIGEYCDKYKLPKENVKISKLVAHIKGHMIYNIEFKDTLSEESGIDEEFISDVVKKHIKQVQPAKSDTGDDEYFDRLVITDVHIGMSTEGGRNIVPLYDTPWNEDELYRRLYLTLEHIQEFKRGDTIIVDELGDYVDGLFGKTTRGGHDLPQNMSDKECFDLAISFKMRLVDELVNMYEKVVCNSIVNDNHSGVYGYFVSSTVKQILDQKYGKAKVEYNIMERFINHYSVGKHTFILTHGKDSADLKHGYKPFLDAKQAEKIDQYCKEYQLYNGNFIEFSKGDSHQFLFDYSTSRDFVYCNYPAMSPPSSWVKSNFGTSTEAIVFQTIKKDKNIKMNLPLFFNK